jgi:tetratricopeptide (TPR) repeat protein
VGRSAQRGGAERSRSFPGRAGALAAIALALFAARAGTARDAGDSPAIADPAAGDVIERAWRDPAGSFETRVERTRRAALEAGVWSLDPAARMLLRSSRDPVERAEAAVRLAPDLPAARMALARALWMRGDSPLAALLEALAALGALLRHLEAALWVAGSGLAMLAAGLVAGGLTCAVWMGALAAPHAAHDLGDAVGGDPPAFARMAVVAVLVCAPALLGAGMLGLALGLLALGALYADARGRVAVAGAAAAVWLGAFPVAELAGRGLEALSRDPVARAALAVDHGSATAIELAALRAGAADADPLAARSLARLARRGERLGEADAGYRELLQDPEADPALANDAANVRLRLGHVAAALDLYERSLESKLSAAVLFNLSQANARAFEVETMTRALARAQSLDGELVSELTRAQGAADSRDFVVDLPLPARGMWERLVRAGDGRAFAAEAREPLAPGRLGREPGLALAGFAAPVLLGSLAGARLRRSRWCTRCGRRSCPRCDGSASDPELCQGCHRLFHQPEQTQRELRVARVAALEERRRRLDRAAVLAALVVPGAAGLVAGRPLGALLACVLFATSGAAVAWRDGVVPDPGVAGAAGPAAFLALATVAAFAYAALVTGALAGRRRA